MKTEKEKMLSGELYNAMDPELTGAREKCRLLLQQYNTSSPQNLKAREALLRELIPHAGKGLYIEPPFYCDYGSNMAFGENVYFNFNCVVLDVAKVTVGNGVLFAPNVQLYAASHPMDWETRASGLELGFPINIGDYVWIGGGSIVCPGVSIGARSVIGAGSVVTRNIPPDVFAAGNPCRVIRPLGQNDRTFLG